MMRRKITHVITLITFACSMAGPLPPAHAQELWGLPEPGALVLLSGAHQPPLIKGITVHKDNPFLFDFIVDVGQDRLDKNGLEREGNRLINYFLTALAVPSKDLWVNLSPYEHERTIPDVLVPTEMGRDLLAQDYLLKQITASLIYPKHGLGKKFWDNIYARIQRQYGAVQVPVNTFNKVWIMADKAEVFERNQTAFVVGMHLKVMLEQDYVASQHNRSGEQAKRVEPEDYVAMTKNQRQPGDIWRKPEGIAKCPQAGCQASEVTGARAPQGNHLTQTIIRQVILPALEKEVNEGSNFATLRQICYSLTLAGWYKKRLRESVLNQVYSDSGTVKGIDVVEGAVREQIYQRYLQAYKRGVFNYVEQGPIPRKYFSGGFVDSAQMADPVIVKDPSTLRGIGDAGGLVALQAALTAASQQEIWIGGRSILAADFMRVAAIMLENIRNRDLYTADTEITVAEYGLGDDQADAHVFEVLAAAFPRWGLVRDVYVKKTEKTGRQRARWSVDAREIKRVHGFLQKSLVEFEGKAPKAGISKLRLLAIGAVLAAAVSMAPLFLLHHPSSNSVSYAAGEMRGRGSIPWDTVSENLERAARKKLGPIAEGFNISVSFDSNPVNLLDFKEAGLSEDVMHRLMEMGAISPDGMVWGVSRNSPVYKIYEEEFSPEQQVRIGTVFEKFSYRITIDISPRDRPNNIYTLPAILALPDLYWNIFNLRSAVVENKLIVYTNGGDVHAPTTPGASNRLAAMLAFTAAIAAVWLWSYKRKENGTPKATIDVNEFVRGRAAVAAFLRRNKEAFVSVEKLLTLLQMTKTVEQLEAFILGLRKSVVPQASSSGELSDDLTRMEFFIGILRAARGEQRALQAVLQSTLGDGASPQKASLVTAFLKNNFDHAVVKQQWGHMLEILVGNPTADAAATDAAAAASQPQDIVNMPFVSAAANGGIDLDSVSAGLTSRADGLGVQMMMDAVMVRRIKREGLRSLTPQILGITPVPSIWPLIGLEAPTQVEGQLAAVRP